MRAFACFALLVAAGAYAFAAPIDDLASPDPATRDAAANILRATFKPPPRAKWEPLLAALKPGITEQAFSDQLAQQHLTFEALFVATHGTSFGRCRLDHTWVLSCTFKENVHPSILAGATLATDIESFYHDPPRTFTGTWTCYYANGQKDIEAQIRNGQYSGDATGYTNDGMLNWLGRYDKGKCTDENYYYPSGRIKTRTLHTAQSDYITYYRDNGSIASTETQPNDGAPHPQLPRP